MSKITFLVVPKLRKPVAEAMESLKQAKCKAVFLPLPKILEKYLADFSEGMPHEYLFSQLKNSGLIPEPFNAWKYSAEPVLNRLHKIKQANPELQAYCYGDQHYYKVSAKNTVEISILTLRGSITGKIDVDKWRKLLKIEVEEGAEALLREVDFIASEAGRYEDNFCISGFSGRYVATQLKEEGYDVKIEYLGLPYYFTPLETLKKEIGDAEVSDERIKSLVSYHIDYIRRYVVRSRSPDEAYHKWVRKESERLKLPAVMS